MGILSLLVKHFMFVNRFLPACDSYLSLQTGKSNLGKRSRLPIFLCVDFRVVDFIFVGVILVLILELRILVRAPNQPESITATMETDFEQIWSNKLVLHAERCARNK